MRFFTIFLLFISLASEAEIGVDVGFKFVCSEPEGLILTSYIGSPDSSKTDPAIIMERATKSCRLGEYNYELVLKHHEARGAGASGGQRTLSIDLSINDKLIFQFVDFANHSVNSIDELQIQSGKYVNPVKVCGRDTLSYSREIDGCVSILAQDLILFKRPTQDPISDILSYSRKSPAEN
jgi:hypothetical protein